MMVSERDAAAYRALWSSVLLETVRQFREDLRKAASDPKRLSRETRAVDAYFRSRDARLVLDMAGIQVTEPVIESLVGQCLAPSIQISGPHGMSGLHGQTVRRAEARRAT